MKMTEDEMKKNGGDFCRLIHENIIIRENGNVLIKMNENDVRSKWCVMKTRNRMKEGKA